MIIMMTLMMTVAALEEDRKGGDLDHVLGDLL